MTPPEHLLLGIPAWVGVYLFSAVAFFVAGYLLYVRVIRLVMVGKPANRTDRPMKRLIGAIPLVLGQSKVLQSFSPLRDLLVDIAERGRSLGVLLIGAQQAASAVAQALPRNASLKVAGRLDASESDAYRYLTPALRERATRFMPGTMVVSQPIVPEPIPIRFPFPPFATNPDEAAEDEEAADARAAAIVRTVGALAGPKVEL